MTFEPRPSPLVLSNYAGTSSFPFRSLSAPASKRQAPRRLRRQRQTQHRSRRYEVRRGELIGMSPAGVLPRGQFVRLSGILKDYRIIGERLLRIFENELSEFSDYRTNRVGGRRTPINAGLNGSFVEKAQVPLYVARCFHKFLSSRHIYPNPPGTKVGIPARHSLDIAGSGLI
jgi:hypothetical protein